MSPTAFDAYARSIVVAALAIGLVGSAVYALLFAPRVAPELTTWAGVVVGVYFGSHATANGVAQRRVVRAQQQAVDRGEAAPVAGAPPPDAD